MPCYHHKLLDLKSHIPVLFFEQDFTVKEICKILGIQKSLAYSCLMYFRTYSITHNPHIHRKTGRRCLLHPTDIKFVTSLIKQRHTIYLDEIQDELFQHREICISVPTLCQTLRCLSLTCKVVSARALERDNLVRSAFMNHISDEVPDPRMLMFIDEAAQNRRTSQWSKGWALLVISSISRTERGEVFYGLTDWLGSRDPMTPVRYTHGSPTGLAD
ncbi:hypothetical protein DFH94DRAFT_621680 [Russula ochroleuca]|jgi:hypothetical protein|uniref:Transposase n=1 Tax=Russula ochroleuca TaxID=152965 RepID=A0A9P5TE62_9AGAM|nr:hypothetical protein DFH94DRAFT_621680 [Russula ochroleuca]